MSDRPAHPDTQRCPAIAPDILDALTADLLAAIPPPPGSDPADRFGYETRLIAELDALHPRDLEEAMLASEFLIAHHTGTRCFAEAARRKPAGRKACRLRREGLALQRAAQAARRALHKSQQRPVLEDPADLVPRPTVPTVAPKPPPAARPAERAAAQAAAAKTAAEAEAAAPPKPRKDPFEGHPDLQALSDRWYDLPPWEQMTPEERRKTFGYSYTPKPATAGEGDTAAPA